MSNLGSTKIFVDKSQWNNNTSRQKGRSSEALAVNASLDAISTNLHNIYRKYEDDESISLDKLRAAYLRQAKDRLFVVSSKGSSGLPRTKKVGAASRLDDNLHTSISLQVVFSP